MSSEVEEIRRQLGEVADSIWAGVPELVAAFLPELARVEQAREEVYLVLSAGIDNTTSIPVRNSYGNARNKQLQLCDATLKLAQDALVPLTSTLAGSTPQPLPDDPAMPDLREALAKLHALDLGMDICRLFTGLVLVRLLASFEEYLDACEAYLGRDIGSHEALKRIAPVLVTALWGLPGALLGPVGGLAEVIYEAGKQAVTSPLDENLKRVRQGANEMARLETLRAELGHRLEAMPFVQGILASAVNGSTEQMGAASSYLEVIRPLLAVPAPSPKNGAQQGGRSKTSRERRIGVISRLRKWGRRWLTRH